MLLESLTNVWIVVLLLIMVGWDQREEAPLKWLISPLVPLIRWSGLWHCWNMFAPNVSRVTPRVEVIVKFADGGSATWTPPGWIPRTRWGAL